ncbi:MAG: hypothetical protein AAFO94_21375, partial [Bacteroidota bacterium]
KPWRTGRRLYYFGWSKEQAARYGDWNLNHLDASNANTVLTFDESQQQKHFNAIRCYPSQYKTSEMDWWIGVEQAATERKLYFREYVPLTEPRNSF